MKKLFSTAMALVSLAAMSGCSDYLDQDIRSEVSSTGYYATATGFGSLTTSAYSQLRTLYKDFPWMFEGGTDMIGSGKASVNPAGLYGQAFNSADKDVLSLYKNCYIAIQAANSVIFYGATSEESKVREQYIDEARFIRAYVYLVMVQQWGGVAIQKEMFSAAVMNHKRNSAEEVYDFIITELTELSGSNSKLLVRKDAKGTNWGRANKEAAKMLLAKAYLCRGYEACAKSDDFENAYKTATELIGTNGTAALAVDFEKVFNYQNEENDEILWSVQWEKGSVIDTQKDGNTQQAIFGPYLGGAEKHHKYMSGGFCPTIYAYKNFTEGDLRYEATFMEDIYDQYYYYYTKSNPGHITYHYTKWYETDFDEAAWRAADPENRRDAQIIRIDQFCQSKEILNEHKTFDFESAVCKKFDDPTSEFSLTGSMRDYIACRMGECYLIAAEAATKKGDAAAAAIQINALRSRVGVVKPGFEDAMTVNSSDIDIDFILDERGREMLGEYKRWEDLKRTGKLVERVVLHNIEQPATTAEAIGQKILRPIPLSAIELNKEEVQQNPGF